MASDSLELAAASFLTTLTDLLKPWAKMSIMAATVVEALIKDAAGMDVDASIEDLKSAHAVATVITKMHKEHGDRQQELAAAVIQLLETGKVERAVKLCQAIIDKKT